MIGTLSGEGASAHDVKKTIAIFTYTVAPSDPLQERCVCFEPHMHTYACAAQGTHYTGICMPVQPRVDRHTYACAAQGTQAQHDKQSLFSLDMKTKVVLHVSRINILHLTA